MKTYFDVPVPWLAVGSVITIGVAIITGNFVTATIVAGISLGAYYGVRYLTSVKFVIGKEGRIATARDSLDAGFSVKVTIDSGLVRGSLTVPCRLADNLRLDIGQTVCIVRYDPTTKRCRVAKHPISKHRMRSPSSDRFFHIPALTELLIHGSIPTVRLL